MKEGHEYLEMLTDQEQEEWLKAYEQDSYNCKYDRHIVDFLCTEFPSFREFILKGFYAGLSPQGVEYWIDIATKYQEQ